MSLKRFTALRPGKPLDRGSRLRARSKNPRAVTKAGLWRVLARWTCAEGVCALCGAHVGPSGLDPHHLVTKGSEAALSLCAADLIPVCREFVGCRGHARAHGTAVERAEFREQVERLKPGIYAHLKYLARTVWHKRPLDEIEAEVSRVTRRTWREHWDALEVSP